MQAAADSHRAEHGAALPEAAIALPLFLLLVAGIIDFTTVLRQRQFVLQALARAERAAAAVSAVEGIEERDLLLKAGEVYAGALKESGVSLAEVALGGDEADPFVLIGRPFQGFPAGAFPAPSAYELRTVYIPRCMLCGLTGLERTGLGAALVAVRETAVTTGVYRPTGQVLGYFPARSGDSRVHQVQAN